MISELLYETMIKSRVPQRPLGVNKILAGWIKVQKSTGGEFTSLHL